MFSIVLPWKNFNVNLGLTEEWLKSNSSAYVGNSADTELRLWFTDEPDEATKQHIQDYWDGLNESSAEATSYISASDLQAAVLAAREDAITKTWDQLSIAQKKLLAGLTPTREDLGV